MRPTGCRYRLVAGAVAGVLAVSACGSDDSATPVPSPLDTDGTPAVRDPVETPEPDTAPVSSADQPDQVLGTGNVGGTVVDPQPHPIDDIAVAESYPEQLMIRFTSGDPQCTAADAIAVVSGSTVVVSLQVGITEDALSRSCLVGDVEQTLSIVLAEGLDGREVIAAEA